MALAALCVSMYLKLTKGQTRMVCGTNLACRLQFEKACAKKFLLDKSKGRKNANSCIFLPLCTITVLYKAG